MTTKANPDSIYKIIVIGESNVGKKEIIRAYSDINQTQFVSGHGEHDFIQHVVDIDGKMVKLTISDTDRQGGTTINSSYYKDANGIMLVYDVYNVQSFENLQTWITEVEQNCHASVSKMILGNNAQHGSVKRKHQLVSSQAGKKFSQERKYLFMEVNGLTNGKVHEAFMKLAKDIKKNQYRAPNVGIKQPRPCATSAAKQEKIAAKPRKKIASEARDSPELKIKQERPSSRSAKTVGLLTTPELKDKADSSINLEKYRKGCTKKISKTFPMEKQLDYLLTKSVDGFCSRMCQKLERTYFIAEAFDEVFMLTERKVLVELADSLPQSLTAKEDALHLLKTRISHTRKLLELLNNAKKNEQMNKFDEQIHHANKIFMEYEDKLFNELDSSSFEPGMVGSVSEFLPVSDSLKEDLLSGFDKKSLHLPNHLANAFKNKLSERIKSCAKLAGKDTPKEVVRATVEEKLGEDMYNAKELLTCRSSEPLGKGTFGCVRLAFHKYLGWVAVKCFSYSEEHERRKILEECEILRLASHPNVVHVYGIASWQVNAIGLVLEYMPGGSLYGLLSNKRSLGWFLKLRIFSDIAAGLSFLHNRRSDRRIAHNDIKPRNILLTAELHCKLSDFGGARLAWCTAQIGDVLPRNSGTEYTMGFASPERLRDPSQRTTKAMDVYSYGMTGYCIITQESPVSCFLNDKNRFIKFILDGGRPSLDIIKARQNLDTDAKTIVDLLVQQIERCWASPPNERPNIVAVRDSLYDALRSRPHRELYKEVCEALQAADCRYPRFNEDTFVAVEQFAPPDFRPPSSSPGCVSNAP